MRTDIEVPSFPKLWVKRVTKKTVEPHPPLPVQFIYEMNTAILDTQQTPRAGVLFVRTGPDPVAQLLGTGFRRFTTVCAGIGLHGLYRDDGPRLEILAVHATKPNVGLFRAFIAKAKTIYDEIEVLEVWNPGLAGALARYGFQAFTCTTIEDREVIEGMVWKR